MFFFSLKMLVALFARRAFELLAIFHLISNLDSISNIDEKKIETILTTMRIESRANLTRYRLVGSAMRRHLINYEKDVSPVHLLIHPKANSRVIEGVAKACSQQKPTLLWTENNRQKDRSCNRMETCSRVTQIIGIYSNVDDVNPRELKDSYGNAWYSRSKIVILITNMTSASNDGTEKATLEKILKFFWSLDCLNIVLMMMPGCEKNCTIISEPRIFSYDPFAPQISTSNKRGQLLERSARTDFFPDKLRNLRGFSIPVSIYHREPHAILKNYTELESGIEVLVLRYISDWLNFTVDLKTAPIEASSYKVSLSGDREIGMIGDIMANRSDFLANTVLVGALAGTRLEFVRPFTTANIAILVPRAGPMPGIIRVFRSIDSNLAIVIFICWILLALYFSARKNRHPFMKTYRLFIHQQLEGISDRMADRIFSIAWIIWAFVLCTAFQSQVKKDLTDPPYYNSIDTLEELASSPLILVGEPNYLNDLNISFSETKKQLAENAVSELDFARCTKRLVIYKDVACALDASFMRAATKKLNRKYKRDYQRRRGIAHIVKEYLTDDWRTMVVKEGFPYLDKFNIIYLRLRESGLMQKWLTDDLREHFETRSKKKTRFKLNMEHFEGPFYILLIGEGTALLALIVEIIFCGVKRRLFRSHNGLRIRVLFKMLGITKFVK